LHSHNITVNRFRAKKPIFLFFRQFVRAKAQEFTPDILSGLNVGKKDVMTSLFSMWEEVFFLTRHPAKPRLLSLIEPKTAGMSPKPSAIHDAETANSHLNRLVSMVDTTNDQERILEGEQSGHRCQTRVRQLLSHAAVATQAHHNCVELQSAFSGWMMSVCNCFLNFRMLRKLSAFGFQ
jgi:hypothetical protein